VTPLAAFALGGLVATVGAVLAARRLARTHAAALSAAYAHGLGAGIAAGLASASRAPAVIPCLCCSAPATGLARAARWRLPTCARHALRVVASAEVGEA
jgi:alpha-beta hydrolase superfamily lysophospholipase